jgi:excisionase family DNA binding protein
MKVENPNPGFAPEEPSASPQDLGTEPLWTAEEVAQYLKLQPETVRTMARRGELPCLKLGKRLWRFRPAEIKNWVLTNQNNSSA